MNEKKILSHLPVWKKKSTRPLELVESASAPFSFVTIVTSLSPFSTSSFIFSDSIVVFCCNDVSVVYAFCFVVVCVCWNYFF